VESKHILAENARSYYLERKRLGVCVRCGRKAEAGGTKCGVCVGKDRERRMVLHLLFCGECKRPIKSEERSGRRLHKLCAQKRQALRLVDFTEGAHPISTKGTIEISGAKRRNDL